MALLRRQASARQALARALGHIDPLLAAGIRLRLAGTGVGGTRAVVLSGLGHPIALLHLRIAEQRGGGAGGRAERRQPERDVPTSSTRPPTCSARMGPKPVMRPSAGRYLSREKGVRMDIEPSSTSSLRLRRGFSACGCSTRQESTLDEAGGMR